MIGSPGGQDKLNHCSCQLSQTTRVIQSPKHSHLNQFRPILTLSVSIQRSTTLQTITRLGWGIPHEIMDLATITIRLVFLDDYPQNDVELANLQEFDRTCREAVGDTAIKVVNRLNSRSIVQPSLGRGCS